MSDMSNYWANYMFGAFRLLDTFGHAPLSAAGQMLLSVNKAEADVEDEDDITDELHAALRRCQIRSMWPTWDHKAGEA